MELTIGQRRLAFALVVFALAGLGVYLFTSAGHSPAGTAGGHGAGGRPPVQQPVLPSASLSPASTPAASSPPATAPASPAASGAVPDIYRWLPFSKSGLAAAAATAVRFGDAYATFSYTQSTAAYVATLHGLVTSTLSQQIAAAYSTPGVASLRKSRKQVSVGSATITSLRAFGANSLTFLVSVTEQITATRGAGPDITSYAVTVQGGGSDWQVNDIELAGAGNN
jgi:hypothetical protein